MSTGGVDLNKLREFLQRTSSGSPNTEDRNRTVTVDREGTVNIENKADASREKTQVDTSHPFA